MDIPDDWVLQILISVGSGLLGGSGIALGLFKFYGQSWIKSRFDKDLEQAKSELSVHARKHMTWQDKEYEVFSELWTRLCDAQQSLILSVKISDFPDFMNMGDDEFEIWLNGLDWDGNDKEAMRDAEDRRVEYFRIMNVPKSREAAKICDEFLKYLLKNRIFLNPDIKTKFDNIGSKLRDSWKEQDAGLRHKGEDDFVSFLLKTWSVFSEELTPLMAEIEDIIQARLYPDSTSILTPNNFPPSPPAPSRI